MTSAVGRDQDPFEGRWSLRTWLLVPLASLGSVLVIIVTITAAVAAQAQTEQDAAAEAAQSARVAIALLTQTDQRLVGSARQIATARSLRDAIDTSSQGALTADLVATQVNQQLGLAAVINSGGVVVAGTSPEALRAARLDIQGDTLAQLETSRFVWLDDELWLLAGAAHRTAGRAPLAAIVGVRLDGPALAALSALSGAEISFHLAGRSAGLTPPDSRSAAVTSRTMHGSTVAVHAAVAFAPYRSSLSITILFIAAAGLTTLLLFVLLGAWIVRRIVRPLSRLATAAAALAAGDDAGPAATGGPREVAVTSDAFNRMATAVREREAALREATATASQLSRLRGEFVSIVSHEFRTPLTGIQGFSEMMRDDELTVSEMRDYAGDINKDAMRLARLISDMLDLDRMESGQMALSAEAVDLNGIIVDAAAQFRLSSRSHPIELDLDRELPKLLGDPDRLTQVVTNLLSNAIKYSPAGGAVELRTKREENTIALTVRDHGIGIPVDHLDKIFDRYSRIETTATQSVKGTGLGLPIVRQIVQLFHGRVWATSKLGEGSIFHVQLPLSLAVAPAPSAVAA